MGQPGGNGALWKRSGPPLTTFATGSGTMKRK